MYSVTRWGKTRSTQLEEIGTLMHPASDCLPKYSLSWSNAIASDLAQVTFPLCSHVWRILLASVAKPPCTCRQAGLRQSGSSSELLPALLWWRRDKAGSLLDVPFTVLRLVPKCVNLKVTIYDLSILCSVLWEKHLLCACMTACGLKSRDIWQWAGEESPPVCRSFDRYYWYHLQHLFTRWGYHDSITWK